MRIALIVPGFSAHKDHWVIPALQLLATGLAQRHEIHVFSQRYPAQGTYHFEGLTHHAQGSGERRGIYSPWVWGQSCRAVLAQHKRTPFDVIHAFWADEAGLSAVWAGQHIQRPVIVSIGGWELVNLPQIEYGAQRFWVKRRALNYVFQRASLITAGSAYQLEMCRAHGIAENKLRFAPLGVDTERFKPETPSPLRKRLTLLQAASLLPVKNQTLLLQALALLKARGFPATLKLIGAGPLKDDLQHKANSMGLQDDIIWSGNIPYSEMPQALQTGDIYLQSSHHESQGMAVLEAMACGLPVLGTPVGVAADTACLPPTFSAETLAEQVVALLGDETRYRQFQQAARERVLKSYSLSFATNSFERLYEEVRHKDFFIT